MLVSDFNFELPDGLVARYPMPDRHMSRLLVVDRKAGTVSDDMFTGIGSHLKPGDLLVLNNTRVIPARLFGSKKSGGRVELLLVRRLDRSGEVWECLLKASKGGRPGTVVYFGDGVTAELQRSLGNGLWEAGFNGFGIFEDWLAAAGKMPIPPYLGRDAEPLDVERYQTVFAEIPGAVAAPTAGLHFSHAILESLKRHGINSCHVTLHTGPGTFMPVRSERVEDHVMHRESYAISGSAAVALNETRRNGGRIVAVGTTSARTLEFAADHEGMVAVGSGEADIFIYPGYEFKAVDVLLTNFHLPESTLLMLVCAFGGRELVMSAYRHAVSASYRFYSYGDAMLVV